MLNGNAKTTYLLILSGTLFLSCGDEIATNPALESEVSPQVDSEITNDLPASNQETSEFNALEVLESESVPNSDWQINNYANFLIGEDIATNTDDLNYDNGMNYYYQTLDIPGGFASVAGSMEGWKEFVVWRMADGDDLVGEMTVECGPACGYIFNFYKGLEAEIVAYPQDKLFPLVAINRHSEEMLVQILEKYPVDYPEDSQLIYNFPQEGTGMRVDLNIGADEIQVPIIRLEWDRSIFYVAEFLDDPNPID